MENCSVTWVLGKVGNKLGTLPRVIVERGWGRFRFF